MSPEGQSSEEQGPQIIGVFEYQVPPGTNIQTDPFVAIIPELDEQLNAAVPGLRATARMKDPGTGATEEQSS